MSNFKRGRPKHQRSGCLLCKYYKDERRAKTLGGSQMKYVQVPVNEVLDEEYGPEPVSTLESED